MKKLEECNWKAFSLTDLFDFNRGNQNEMNSLLSGSIPLISAKKVDNGLKSFVTSDKIFEGHCLTLNNDGDGGAGLSYFQPFDFALDSHVTALYHKTRLSKYALLFLSRCVSQQEEFFGHGHSISTNRLHTIKIMLPITSEGNPDYAYMENYMKVKELQILKKYLEFV